MLYIEQHLNNEYYLQICIIDKRDINYLHINVGTKLFKIN